MGMTIDDIKHCLLVMIDCELCEECNLYGTTGTDHCEHDCVDGALHIIDKYQQLQADYENRLKADLVAILTEIQLEVHELWDNDPSYIEGVHDSEMVIQQKINSLKEGT